MLKNDGSGMGSGGKVLPAIPAERKEAIADTYIYGGGRGRGEREGGEGGGRGREEMDVGREERRIGKERGTKRRKKKQGK